MKEVEVYHPNGGPVVIPEDQLRNYVARGYKIVEPPKKKAAAVKKKDEE